MLPAAPEVLYGATHMVHDFSPKAGHAEIHDLPRDHVPKDEMTVIRMPTAKARPNVIVPPPMFRIGADA